MSYSYTRDTLKKRIRNAGVFLYDNADYIAADVETSMLASVEIVISFSPDEVPTIEVNKTYNNIKNGNFKLEVQTDET